MNHDVIIALDFPSAQDVYAFLDKFQDTTSPTPSNPPCGCCPGWTWTW